MKNLIALILIIVIVVKIAFPISVFFFLLLFPGMPHWLAVILFIVIFLWVSKGVYDLLYGD